MKPLIAWPPLSAEIVAALQRLEAGTEFAGLRSDYDLVDNEARRRSLPALFAMLPGAALYALVYSGLQALGWLRLPELLSNLGWLLIVIAAGLGANAIRGAQAVKDETRIGAALSKWRKHAENSRP